MSSYICQPKKWIWGVIPLALPFIGAYFLNSPIMVSKIADKASQSLTTKGFDNLKLAMDGRDATLSGQVETKEAISRAVGSVLATRGVRRVDFSAVSVEPPVVLSKPTIKPQSTNNARPVIIGTWPAKLAKTLEVKIGDKSYLLGKDKELSSDEAGNWTLKPATKIADGTHDIVVAVSDGKKAAAADQSNNELTIDTVAPNAPVVATKLVTRNPSPTISGNWAHKDAKSLIVGFAGKFFTLGKDKELTVDEKGGWLLTPGKPLKDGTYDILAKTTDAFGNVSQVVAAKVLRIDATAPQNGTVSVIQGKNTTPEITGRWDSANDHTLKVEVGGVSYVSGKDKALKAGKDGKWSLVPSKPLSEGKHNVVITTSDTIGNKSILTAPGAVIVDTTAPAAPVVTATINSATTPTIKGTWIEKAGNSLRVAVAGRVFVLGRDKQLTSDGAGNWILNLSQPLGDGKHSILAESSDPFGNLARTQKPTIVVVDTTKPAAPTINGQKTNDNSPAITGTWANKDNNALQVDLVGRKYVLGNDPQLSTDSKGNWTLAIAKPLPDGIYSPTVTVTDQAGNKSEATAKDAILIDTVKPATAAINPLQTNLSKPVISGSWSAQTGETLQVSVNNKSYQLGKDKQLSSDGKGSWKLAIDAPFGDGAYDVTAKVTDRVGNFSNASAPKAIVIDTKKPVSPTIRAVESASPTVGVSGTWPNVSGNSLSVILENRTYQLGKDKELTSDGNGSWKLTPPKNLPDGVYSVTAKVTDKTGNRSAALNPRAIIIDSTPPPAPTVTTMLTRDRTPKVTGSWNPKQATTLSVTFAGETYSSKNSGEIRINGVHWSIQPTKSVGDGTYDVVAVASDKLGNTATDTGKGEIVIDGTSPTAPTVRPVFGTNKRPLVSGNWQEDGQNTLAVTFNGNSYSLGKNSALTSDGKGNWKLALDNDLAPGSYDVKVKVADKLGNQSNDVSSGEIWVKKVKNAKEPKVEPKTMSAPATTNCQREFTSALAGQSIHFFTNKATIQRKSIPLINKLAGIAQKCPSAQIEISGHTDSRGSAVYNQSLSEARAGSVVDALVKRGVAKSRLRAVGYGETKPIGDNNTRDGQAQNRRIEFKVEQ